MRQHIKLTNFFFLLFSAKTFLLLLIIFLSFLIIQNKKFLVASTESRYTSYTLANELLNSSDDLTRLVRTYVVTGEPRYEQQFWGLLAIRNGEKPRPQHYHSIYWDFMAVGIEQFPAGQMVSLKQLMKQSNITEQEFNLLHQAQLNSDNLTQLENIAMHAVKGQFLDRNGAFSIKGEPDFNLAKKLVYGEEYHQAKLAIMEPIYKFFKVLEQRTASEVNAYQTKDYQYFYSLVALIFILLASTLLSYFGIIRLKRSEEELRWKQEFLRLVMDNIPQLIFWKDVDSEYLGCNKALAKIAGISNPEEIVGKHDSDLVWYEYSEDFVSGDQDVMKNDKPCLNVIEQVKQVDGQTLWVETNKIPLHDVKGRVIGILGTVADITMHKKAEEVLGEYNQRLKEEVAAQTEELTAQSEELMAMNEELQTQSDEIIEKNQYLELEINQRKAAETQLQQAKQTADTANQAKSTFLANMSHELRTPLNGILGYTQILNRDHSLNPKQKEGIQVIQRSGEYLLTLINDILDLAKIEANRIELYPSSFHFEGFLLSIVDLFKMRAEQKGILFTYEKLTQLPMGVYADETRLRQVLINLLGNAIKFTNKGQVTFKVGYDNQQTRFQIEDTGTGIAQTDIEHIFQPFQQTGDNHYKAEGTGLGLAITQRIVHMMEGNIQVKSELGKGSCFWIALDLAEADDMAQQDNISHTDTIIGYQEQRKTLLIVDYMQENRAVLLDLLSPLGFNLIQATDGQQGLEIALEQQPDIILTDIVMPNLTGLKMVQKLRQQPQFCNVPMIAISASVFEHNQQQSLEAGCNAFIPKPFKVDELLNTLQQCLNLTWQYESVDTDAINLLSQTPAEELIPLDQIQLSSSQAAALHNLAMQGDIAGVLQYTQELVELDNKLLSFARKIEQLARLFEDEQICEMVEPFLDPS
ncbi:ATP-binding protein [Candidatus Albibeggiatoa sp. nov. BB20]|uniref:ATP-binding protein n=1 Tax=Candidatus Albibeggiatoa sp. nov. BB20 TaxID=3162723 RepID=UPI003365A696